MKTEDNAADRMSCDEVLENVTTSPGPDEELAKVQGARAFLRERFLRVLTSLTGNRATFQMMEKTVVRCEFLGCDAEGTQFCVRDLQTPLGVHPHALLRSSDVISVKINLRSPQEMTTGTSREP